MKLSPGLKLLLAGEEEPESGVSIDIPTGSLRHSRHSSICSRLSTKKDNIRSPLTDEVFKKPSEDNEDAATFSTFKNNTKKETVVEQPEPSVVDSPPPDEGNLKRKSFKRESFLKRLFSRKRSSSSGPQSPPPAQKKHYAMESNDSRTSLKEDASLQERIEFYQTPLSVEIFDDDGTCLQTISEEAQQTNVAVVSSSLPTSTTVEINSTSNSVSNHQVKANDDDDQATVKTVAESVAESVVNHAISVVENDVSKSVEAKKSNSLPQTKTSTKAPKVKKKKKKEKQITDTSIEEAVITHDEASAETVKVEFKKANKNTSSSDLDLDTSSESNESNTSDNKFDTKPMEIEEFENFGEDVDKAQKVEFNHIHCEKQSAGESSSDTHLASMLDTPTNDMTFSHPANGIPSTVVRAIHKDLQVLSESIDKDLDKLLNENQEQEDDLLKMDEDISSSVSNIAMEKLQEAQVIPDVPLLQLTPDVTAEPMVMPKESATDSAQTSAQSRSIVKRLSSTFSQTTVEDKKITKSPSVEGKPLKKSSSIQEKLKLFGEKISEATKSTTPLQSNSITEKPQQEDPAVTKPITSQQSSSTGEKSHHEDAKPPSEISKVEESDVVTPLKIINSTSLRRGSLPNVNKLKLDGLTSEMQEPSSVEANTKKWRMSPLELTNKPGSPVSGRRFMDLGSPLSPLRASLKKHDPESLELYMNSANLDYLTNLHEKTLDEARVLAIKRAEALLEEPKLNVQTIPDVFREIHSQGNSKLIWCVKDTWYSWLEGMDELPMELDSEDCYILLHVSK